MQTTIMRKHLARVALVTILMTTVVSGPLAGGETRTVPPFDRELFEVSEDIGAVLHSGSTHYDPDDQVFVLEGSGTNMWGAEDEFHFAWRKMKGDFILSANMELLGEGVDPHRKMGWMIRESLATDAAYVDVALHGDGLTSMQFRRTPGGETEEVVSAVSGPDVLRLERRDGRYFMSVAVQGELLSTAELIGVELPEEVYVGLFVCAHNPDVVERGRFSNVRVTIPAPDDFRPYQDYYGSRLEVMDVTTGNRRVLHTTEDSMQAPNWTRDGEALIYNRNGRLYRFDLASGEVLAIDTGFAVNNNNDHAISFDGSQLAISHHAEDHGGDSLVYTLPIGGGTPRLVTPEGPSYFHGWSPDGKWLTYTGGRDGSWEIYKIRSDGSGTEVRLTDNAVLDDGSEFSPDGETIWFNSARSGRMQIWSMNADGTNQRPFTDDAYNNWSPHVSPDGKQVVYLAYGPDVEAEDHPWYRQVYIMIKPVDGGEARVLANLYGGQGTINVASWSPDGRYIAFVSNSAAEQ